jgi:hypothetical protein
LECFLRQEWLYIVLGKPSKTPIGVVKIECPGIVEVSKIKKNSVWNPDVFFDWFFDDFKSILGSSLGSEIV